MAGILNPKGKGKTPPRITPSMKKEFVKARDFLKFDTRFSCEDCSHYDGEKVVCTLGYNPRYHLKAEQEHQFNLGGTMAFCRFIEID